MPCRIFLQGHFFLLRYCEYPFDLFRRIYYNRVCDDLTESSKSPASIAKSNKQWVGTCLYQEECKLLLINCGAVIRL